MTGNPSDEAAEMTGSWLARLRAATGLPELSVAIFAPLLTTM